jgi:MFS family permease
VALSSFRPLHSRNFALVWSAALVSNVGSWMQTVALGYVITAHTHNPLWTGLVAAAAFLPMGLLAPLGGALADRLDRRTWLITTTLAEATFAAVLAVLAATGHSQPLILVAVAFLGGTSAAVGFPTYQAMLPDLVPREDLLAAVSLSSAQFNLGRVIGPALAGIVLVVGSDAWAFAVNAASFGAVVVALLFVRLPVPKAATVPVESIVRRIVAGARVAADEPGCRSAIVLIAIVALIGSPFIGLVPAVAIDGLHRGAAATSALVTGQGVGAVAGALALAPLARAWGRRRLLLAVLFAFPAALVVYGAAPSLVTATLAIVVVGACYISVLTGLNTVVQLRAPEEARGRVLGLYMMALGTVYPLGLVIQGAIAGAVGIRVVTMASGTLLAVVMAGLVLLRPRFFRAFDDDHTAAALAHDGSSAPATGVSGDQPGAVAEVPAAIVAP